MFPLVCVLPVYTRMVTLRVCVNTIHISLLFPPANVYAIVRLARVWNKVQIGSLIIMWIYFDESQGRCVHCWFQMLICHVACLVAKKVMIPGRNVIQT